MHGSANVCLNVYIVLKVCSLRYIRYTRVEDIERLLQLYTRRLALLVVSYRHSLYMVDDYS